MTHPDVASPITPTVVAATPPAEEQPAPSRPARYLRRQGLNAAALAAGDTLALGAAFFVAGAVRTWWMGAPLIPSWAGLILPAWWVGAFFMHLLPSWGLGTTQELRRIILLTALLYAGAMAALFITKQTEGVSRMTLTTSFVASLVLVPLVRVRLKRMLIGLGVWGLPAVIYGAGDAGARVTRFLQSDRGIGYVPIGLLDDNPTQHGTQVEGLPVLGPTSHVVTNAPVAILAMPSASRSRLVELVDGPLAAYRSVVVIPDLDGLPSLWVMPRDLNGVLGLELTCNLLNPIARFGKRTLDIALVVLFAGMWVPLCGVIAALIKLEDGSSPLFTQRRVGKHGRAFSTYKFRTMVPNAEEVLRETLAHDAALRREWAATFKLRDDPRMTRIGRLLRRFSLDELPQLWNVLRGEMSLVGPRPLPTYHHEVLPGRVRALRERVRPGMTGLWQVSGRSDAGTDGMEQWDAYYVRNWSLWLDAVIVIRTARVVLNGAGAY